MDKNSPDWKKYKQEQADFLKRNQDALDKKHNIGRYTNTRNTRNPQGYKPYKKGEKPPKVKTYTRGFNIGHIKQDKQDAINDLGNKLSEVESREGWNKTKARIKGLGRRIYPDEGRHGEGGQTSIENPEFHGEKRTGLFGQKQKPSKETAVSEEKPLEELTDGELSEVEKLMYKKMAMSKNTGKVLTPKRDEDYGKNITQMDLQNPTPTRVRGHGVGTPKRIKVGDKTVKVPRTAEDVTTSSGNEKTSTRGNMQMAGILGKPDNAKPTKEQMDEYLDIAHHGERPKTESFSRKKRESQADLEAKFEHPDYNIATGEIEHGFRNRKKKGGIKEKLRKLVTVPDIYPSEIKNIESRERREKASKEKEVECPHCSGEGRMAMSFGYGAGVGTCRNCGGKGKGTEFHYTDTEGNMKKSWEIWLEKKKDQGQGDARYGNPHETGMEDPRKLQTTKDDFSMEEKKIIKKMTRYNTKPYIQIERDSN